MKYLRFIPLILLAACTQAAPPDAMRLDITRRLAEHAAYVNTPLPELGNDTLKEILLSGPGQFYPEIHMWLKYGAQENWLPGESHSIDEFTHNQFGGAIEACGNLPPLQGDDC
jgi:hypothetical protein